MNAAARKQRLPQDANHDTCHRDELILEYLPLVTAIASHIQKTLPIHIELDDLTHAGMAGLFDAASKYRADKNVAFPTYAKHRIRGAILDSLRQMDCASRDLRRRYKQMEAVTRDLTAKLRREPTETEIAQGMGMDRQRWQALMVDFRNLGVAALQQKSTPREEQPVLDVPSSPQSSPEEMLAKAELRAKLNVALQTLPLRYQKVVQLYYERELTMKEIGGILGVNESRVSQIHKSALQRIHVVLENSGIHSAAAF
jgi:RNA polymerase sigma factor for flagellar operon FliA